MKTDEDSRSSSFREEGEVETFEQEDHLPPEQAPTPRAVGFSGKEDRAPSAKQVMGQREASQRGDMTETSVHAESGPKSYAGSVTTLHSDSHNSSGLHPVEIGSRESGQIRHLRILLGVILLLAAALVCTAMYLLTTRAETEEFEAEYNGVAAKVLESFEQIVGEKIGAVSSLAVAATSYAQATNTSWPYVSLNDFDYRTASILTQADCLLLQILPKVTDLERAKWENYSMANMDWYNEGLVRQAEVNAAFTQLDAYNPPFIFYYAFDPVTFTLGIAPDPGPGDYTPVWQHAPLLPAAVNLNALSYGPYAGAIRNSLDTGKMSLEGVFFGEPGDVNSQDVTTQFYAILLSLRAREPVEYKGEPMSYTTYPIFDTNDEATRKPVATVGMVVHWASYFKEVVPPETPPVTVVLENDCDGAFTFTVDNENVVFEGAGDSHDTDYNHLERQAALNTLYSSKLDEQSHNLELDELGCPFRIRVYPTSEMEEENRTKIPLITTIAVGVAFLFTAAVFFLYNHLVERRQKIVLTQATQSTAIVESFLPDAVQQRLLAATEDDMKDEQGAYFSPMSRLKSFLAEGEDNRNAKPIADLFPYTTVLFADIEGFTAWSSTREPAQVFVLLQSVYSAFDQIAKRYKVFKVETIGDSYVAATGIPNDQPRHAVLMARFAWQCLVKMDSLVKELEVSLGPDTADLAMRFGMHSGPVTAGVLRGERPRFQLFGDTVNTAARMESTGRRNRIQVSYTTAAELEKFNKGHWLCRRMDEVEAKGKGILETYWLEVSSRDIGQNFESTVSQEGDMEEPGTPVIHEVKRNRLIEWVVELLADHLRRIQARRQGLFLNQTCSDASLVFKPSADQTCLDEVQESMAMPTYDPKAVKVQAHMDHRSIEIPERAIEELREYVSIIASAYRQNSFHNFEHASHVVMSVDKFLKRIVSPNMEKGDQKKLHEYTHGLTSDPLVLLAIVWSALIHDVDHRGVSNAQLAKEEKHMADTYKQKSVAEQHSLDVSWSVLMREDFSTLRKSMFLDQKDLQRFRQVIVNVVLATDIFDKELNDLRKQRWQKAFETKEGAKDQNLRATIVMEHIIQASDVAHTMQHWMIYRKWNERLFLEMYAAYKAGRMEKNPLEFWYQGELKFFDFYIIPLAKK
eukprot:CAMPEP_0172452292 /NCGR_PEP_ID=MMETSP1065-20121228/10005_1 /TAXON_ID=265537 /ORGANISM="Amphiprora paludosa, Strain CCMP125" /LENGTH=1141 /DNA_ID=CAMNT_0013204333 /DNA_START=182 /DNA_END=3604 /DNA_ORIENTATION=+